MPSIEELRIIRLDQMRSIGGRKKLADPDTVVLRRGLREDKEQARQKLIDEFTTKMTDIFQKGGVIVPSVLYMQSGDEAFQLLNLQERANLAKYGVYKKMRILLRQLIEGPSRKDSPVFNKGLPKNEKNVIGIFISSDAKNHLQIIQDEEFRLRKKGSNVAESHLVTDLADFIKAGYLALRIPTESSTYGQFGIEDKTAKSLTAYRQIAFEATKKALEAAKQPPAANQGGTIFP